MTNINDKSIARSAKLLLPRVPIAPDVRFGTRVSGNSTELVMRMIPLVNRVIRFVREHLRLDLDRS